MKRAAPPVQLFCLGSPVIIDAAVEGFERSSPRPLCIGDDAPGADRLISKAAREGQKGTVMTSQSKPPASTTRKQYVTVEEAVVLLNLSERTVRRMIKDEKFSVIRAKHSIRIDLDDINAYNARKPHEPHPIQTQIDQLRAQVEALQQQVESLAFAQSPAQAASLSSPQLVPFPGVQLSAAEKRGYHAGTQRLVHFARAHHVTADSIKSLYEAGDIALSVYQRPTNPERNKQEWWITPEQHIALAAYWHAHELPCTMCPACSVEIEEQEAKEA